MIGRTLQRFRLGITPLSIRLLVTLALTTAILAAVRLSWVDSFAPTRWTATSAAFREATAFAGPAAAAVAASTAGVRHLLVCGRAPGRGWPAVGRRHLLLLMCATVLGYLLGLVPATLDASLHATAGGPDVLVMVSGLAAMCGWVSVGYLLGALLRPRVGPVIVLVFSFIVVLGLRLASDALTAGGKPRSLLSFAPTWGFDIPVGWHEVSSVTWVRIALALAVVVASGMIVSSLDSAGEGQSLRSLARTSLPLVAPLVLVGIAFFAQPLLMERTAGHASICEVVSTTTVCMNDEEAVLMPVAEAAATDVVALVGGATTVRMMVGEGVDGADGPRVVSTGGDRPVTEEGYRAMFVRDLSAGVGGLPGCWARIASEVPTGAVIPKELADALAASTLVATSIQIRLDVQPDESPIFLDPDAGAAATAFVTALDDEAFGAWLSAHAETFAACQYPLVDVAS